MFDMSKIIRVGSMLHQMLEEQNAASMDAEALDSLRIVYHTTITELKEALPEDLSEELERLILSFDDGEAMTESELKMANAQLLGWLAGLEAGLQLLSMVNQIEAKKGTKPITDAPNESGQYL